MSNIRTYLRTLKQIMGTPPEGMFSHASFMLEYGREWKADLSSLHGDMPQRLCFMNATNKMHDHQGLTYVEGYAVHCGLPMEHAWCVDSNGKVIDPTWKPTYQSGEAVPVEAIEYFGIPFKRKYVTRTIITRGYYGVLDNPQEHFPLYRGLVDTDEFLESRRSWAAQLIEVAV